MDKGAVQILEDVDFAMVGKKVSTETQICKTLENRVICVGRPS